MFISILDHVQSFTVLCRAKFFFFATLLLWPYLPQKVMKTMAYALIVLTKGPLVWRYGSAYIGRVDLTCSRAALGYFQQRGESILATLICANSVKDCDLLYFIIIIFSNTRLLGGVVMFDT
ncbi:hypothetical protein GQ44DRAFT_697289 [Phaeosphaeriaceae sp. PMI808]|nr:hypothetical protein GQ44DRAFT_697289 [Phaeosphaeriaceae sp. PMI808]